MSNKALRGLATAIRQYADGLDGLRDFVDIVGPVLQTREREAIEQDPKALGPLLVALDKLDGLPADTDPQLRQRLLAEFGAQVEDVTVEVDTDEPNNLDRKRARITFREAPIALHDALRRLSKSSLHSALLHRSSLVTLVSSAEWFLSQLLHVFLEEHPEAAGLHKKTLTFAELKQFGSVEDARRHVLDETVEEVLRSSIGDWLTFLREKVHLKLGYLEGVQDALVETYQRRNVIVHNGGIVNSIYLSRTPEALRWKGPPEIPVEVSREYLHERIARFETAFILVGAELWKKLDPTDESRHGLLWGIAWGHMKAERWEIARDLCDFGRRDAALPEACRIVQLLNYWQCRKWLDDFAEVQAEVQAADLSAKDPKFRLGRLALLDQSSDAVSLAKELVGRGDIKSSDLLEWPIFRRLRETDEFKEAFKSDVPCGETPNDAV